MGSPSGTMRTLLVFERHSLSRSFSKHVFLHRYYKDKGIELEPLRALRFFNYAIISLSANIIILPKQSTDKLLSK